MCDAESVAHLHKMWRGNYKEKDTLLFLAAAQTICKVLMMKVHPLFQHSASVCSHYAKRIPNTRSNAATDSLQLWPDIENLIYIHSLAGIFVLFVRTRTTVNDCRARIQQYLHYLLELLLDIHDVLFMQSDLFLIIVNVAHRSEMQIHLFQKCKKIFEI